MKNHKRRRAGWLAGRFFLFSLILSLLIAAGCTAETPDDYSYSAVSSQTAAMEEELVREDGWYHTRDEVAAYIRLYGHLPGNYLTKREARDLGWDSSAGNLWDVADGMSIGGDRFYNNEGLLPETDGRHWYECDIGYEGGYRGAERILYSDDGLIYYTDDHYQTFTCLYDGSES